MAEGEVFEVNAALWEKGAAVILLVDCVQSTHLNQDSPHFGVFTAPLT